jgi:hypothetical protein
MPDDAGEVVPAGAEIARPVGDVADLFLVCQVRADILAS